MTNRPEFTIGMMREREQIVVLGVKSAKLKDRLDWRMRIERLGQQGWTTFDHYAAAWEMPRC